MHFLPATTSIMYPNSRAMTQAILVQLSPRCSPKGHSLPLLGDLQRCNMVLERSLKRCLIDRTRSSWMKGQASRD